VATTRCPACGTAGRYGRHGRYRKYHYRDPISILRLRCRGCGRTHALLPAFSLPGTSIGTCEAQQYLLGRARGLSRAQAGAGLLGQGLHAGYPKQLERRFATAVQQAKALWPEAAVPSLSGLEWVTSACRDSARPLFALNRFALERGVNAICFCRASILLFGRSAGAGCFSHRLDSAPNPAVQVDSG
jgi:hypothetical protein